MIAIDSSKSYDALIIGAGVMGCSIGLALSRKGYRTLNLDRLPAAGYGSTSSSAGIIRTYYSTIEGSTLAYENHFYWQKWRDFLNADAEEILAQYIECGCLVLMAAGGDRLASTQRVMREVGVPFEILSTDELKAKLPLMDMQSYAPPKRIDNPDFGQPNEKLLDGALFSAGGYINDPQLACRNLQQAGKALGASYQFNAEVAQVLKEGGRVAGVRLKDGTDLRAPVVINAAGPHSSRVNDLAGVGEAMNIKTRPLRQEVVHVAFPQEFDFSARGCIVTDGDSGVYMRPEVGNHMLIGSLEPSCDTLEWADADSFNPSLTDQSTNQLWRAAQRFPALTIPNRVQGLAALYDVSSDWIPIYDRSDLPGFFMAIGTSGNQFKNAPVVGEMMAELVQYCGGGADHDAAPLNFHLKHLNRDISMKFFSRKRPVNSQSSFSVLG